MRETKSNQNQIPEHVTQVKMHDGEIDIDTALVNRLLAEQFPHLAGKSITLVQSTGTVNAIFRLGTDLYVRLPRVERWAEILDIEGVWLPKLAPHLSLTIPMPLIQGKPTSWYPGQSIGGLMELHIRTISLLMSVRLLTILPASFWNCEV